MSEFTIGQIEALQDLLKGDEKEDEHVYGSMIKPNKVYGKEGKEKELAKPNTKMQIRPNNRSETGGATFTEEE